MVENFKFLVLKPGVSVGPMGVSGPWGLVEVGPSWGLEVSSRASEFCGGATSCPCGWNGGWGGEGAIAAWALLQFQGPWMGGLRGAGKGL